VQSPYTNVPQAQWVEKTSELVKAYPLEMDELVEIVRESWVAIFKSRIGPHGFRVGEHLFPKPQILAFFLHELIPLELQSRYPTKWRGEETAADKDIVYIPDDSYSM